MEHSTNNGQQLFQAQVSDQKGGIASALARECLSTIKEGRDVWVSGAKLARDVLVGVFHQIKGYLPHVAGAATIVGVGGVAVNTVGVAGAATGAATVVGAGAAAVAGVGALVVGAGLAVKGIRVTKEGIRFAGVVIEERIKDFKALCAAVRKGASASLLVVGDRTIERANSKLRTYEGKVFGSALNYLHSVQSKLNEEGNSSLDNVLQVITERATKLFEIAHDKISEELGHARAAQMSFHTATKQSKQFAVHLAHQATKGIIQHLNELNSETENLSAEDLIMAVKEYFARLGDGVNQFGLCKAEAQGVSTGSNGSTIEDLVKFEYFSPKTEEGGDRIGDCLDAKKEGSDNPPSTGPIVDKGLKCLPESAQSGQVSLDTPEGSENVSTAPPSSEAELPEAQGQTPDARANQSNNIDLNQLCFEIIVGRFLTEQ